jgi:diacylglycerol kinase (ATP)
LNTERTLIILNPHAGSGRAGRLWTQIEPLLWQELGELLVAITQKPDEVAPHLHMARDAGITRVIAIGGDGTNHFIINELARLNRESPDAPRMTFGNLPMGTGRDWSRTLGIPHTPEQAVKWIAGAHPAPVDIGTVSFGGAQNYFLNIASAGASGEVARRTNSQQRRMPWTYMLGALSTLVSYQPPQVRVRLDGQTWYEGKTYLVAVANGRYFGHSMMIAPDARIDDGLLDVVLVEGMPRLEAAIALNTTYTGDHVKRKDVHLARAKVIEIDADRVLSGEKDGELISGTTARFEVVPRALDMLVS